MRVRVRVRVRARVRVRVRLRVRVRVRSGVTVRIGSREASLLRFEDRRPIRLWGGELGRPAGCDGAAVGAAADQVPPRYEQLR